MAVTFRRRKGSKKSYPITAKTKGGVQKVEASGKTLKVAPRMMRLSPEQQKAFQLWDYFHVVMRQNIEAELFEKPEFGRTSVTPYNKLALKKKILEARDILVNYPDAKWKQILQTGTVKMAKTNVKRYALTCVTNLDAGEDPPWGDLDTICYFLHETVGKHKWGG